MEKKSYKYNSQEIEIIKEDNLKISFKINSYIQKIKYMEEKNIKQLPFEQILEDFFSEKNNLISDSTKNSITKIIYKIAEKIIIIVSSQGKDIIWNRSKLINRYGWFFFLVKSYGDKKKVEKKLKKQEIIVKTEYFKENGFEIPVTEKKNMRPLYKTKEYRKYLNIIKTKKIKQTSIEDTLKDFFISSKLIPEKEKESIKKINYYMNERVIVIKSLIGDKMYENLSELVRKYGWYFYITGVSVGKSEVSIAIDKIEKRFDLNYFHEISVISNLKGSNKSRLTLYPIALRPNHNCIILGLGQLNILLDCGITEEFLEEIDIYLENLNEFLKNDEESKIILSKSEEEEVTELEDINELRKFEENDNIDNNINNNKTDININNNENNTENILIQKEEHKKDDIEKVITSTHEIKEKFLVLNEEDFEPKIDAIFLSHSHFDHVSGLKDLVKKFPNVPILCSRITLDLFLLRDSEFLKQELKEEIIDEEYINIIKNVIYVENGDKIKFKEKNYYFSFFHAGHMPGALMLLVKARNYRFLYSGDYTYYDITPFAGTHRFLKQISRPIDFLLIDGSSAYEEYGNPSQYFHSLILFLEQKAEYGDNSLIGADPSSLAISLMLTFWRHFRKKQLKRAYDKRPNIYVDMMVRKNIQVINHRYEYIYGPISRLIRDKANPFNSIKFRWFDRDNLDFLKKKNNIIISHPPDLSYGIIRNIINIIGRNPHNMIFLAGAIHEEPGYSLLNPPEDSDPKERSIELSETWKVPIRALLINKFAPQIKIKLHGDKIQLTEMIKNLEPKEVCFFHENPKKLLNVAEYVTTLGVEKVSTPQERKIIILN
ncbi:MAG: MBL fold metallo-hydrolase [Candidatus Lokiarchaeota archaeon]|nr:MBL fold metallo-hydrolase [Candidatus Lokiarchaeota archaeon]